MTPRTLALPIALAATTLLLAGCVTAPAPLQGAYAPVSPDQVGPGANPQVQVRWGGRVVEVNPGPDRTCFQMLSMPLDTSGRPVSGGNQTSGRFLACRSGFYDPALFTSDREVTFTGRVAGHDQVRIGEYDYTLPRLDADVVYLWPERVDVQVIHHDPYPWGWSPRWWWY